MKIIRNILLILHLTLFFGTSRGYDYTVAPTAVVAAIPNPQSGFTDVKSSCFYKNNWAHDYGKSVSFTNNWLVVLSAWSVIVYKRVLNNWVFTQTFTPGGYLKSMDSNDRFIAVSMSTNNLGRDPKVFIYEVSPDGKSWVQRTDPGNNDDSGYFWEGARDFNWANGGGFGANANSVSMNENNFLFVGAGDLHGVFVYWLNPDLTYRGKAGGAWVEANYNFVGNSAEMCNYAGQTVESNNKWMMTGSHHCDRIEVFKYDETSKSFARHSQIPRPIRNPSPYSYFGSRLALSNDDWLATSAPFGNICCGYVNMAFVFKYDKTTSEWKMKQTWEDKFYWERGYFGNQVAISPDASRVFFGTLDSLFSFKRVVGNEKFEERHEHRAASGAIYDATDGFNEPGWGTQSGSYKAAAPLFFNNLGKNPIEVSPNGDFAAGAGYTILIYAKNTDCVVAETGEAGTIDCKNGGVATGVTGDCGCTCTDGGGYSGITCAVPSVCSLSTMQCLHGGVVQGVTGFCSCDCPTGYRGDDVCAASACTVSDSGVVGTINCLNGGIATGVTDACACSCPAGFLGLTCDTLDTCVVSADDDALNSIACLNGGNATGVTDACACSCAAGFLGLTCDTLDKSQVLLETFTTLEETKQMLNTTEDVLQLTTQTLEETKQMLNTSEDLLQLTMQTLERTKEQLVEATNMSAILVVERDELRTDKSTLHTRVDVCQSNKTTLLAQKLEMEGTVATILNEKNILASSETALATERSALLAERDSLLEGKTMLENEGDVLVGEKATLTSERDSLVENKTMLENERNVLLGEKATLTSERDSLLEGKTMLENERDGLVGEKTTLIQEKTMLTTERDSLLEDKTTLETEIAKTNLNDQVTSPAATDTSSNSNSPVTEGTKIEQRNKELELERMIAMRGEMIMVLAGLLFFCLAVLTILCFCRLARKKPAPAPAVTIVPQIAAPKHIGKFGQFMDKHHDAIKKIGHHEHAVTVQKLSRVHSRRKVQTIQKNQVHAKSRLMARIKQRAMKQVPAAGGASVAKPPLPTKQQKRTEKQREKAKRKEERAAKRSSKAEKQTKRKKQRKKQEQSNDETSSPPKRSVSEI